MALRTSADPTITPSVWGANADAWSGVLIPTPITSGMSVIARTPTRQLLGPIRRFDPFAGHTHLRHAVDEDRIGVRNLPQSFVSSRRGDQSNQTQPCLMGRIGHGWGLLQWQIDDDQTACACVRRPPGELPRPDPKNRIGVGHHDSRLFGCLDHPTYDIEPAVQRHAHGQRLGAGLLDRRSIHQRIAVGDADFEPVGARFGHGDENFDRR